MVSCRSGRGWACACALAAALSWGADARGEAAKNQSLGISLGVQTWRSDMNMKVRSDETGVPGSDIDVGSELGVDTSQLLYVPYLRLSTLYVDYWQNRYEGSQVLNETLTFRGATFPAGEFVNSEMDLKVLSAYYMYNLASDGAGFVGPAAGLKYVRYDGKLDSAAASARANINTMVPVFGVMAFGGDSVRFGGHFLMYNLGYPLFGSEAQIMDGQVSIGYQMSGIAVDFGYHYLKTNLRANKGNSDEIKMDMNMQGFFLTGSITF